MPLSTEDFDGFEPVAAQRYLKRFLLTTRRKGEKYFREGAVQSLECDEPGVAYVAAVQDGELYEVALDFEDRWVSQCSCSMVYNCKHAYAAFRQLLAEYAACTADIPSPSEAGAIAAAPESAPETLAAALQKKLDRKLNQEESRYLANINRLFRQASAGGLQFRNELTGLGLSQGVSYWDRLELFPGKPPTTEGEFWNYLALYLLEKIKIAIPDFMQPVTDLTVARERMRRRFRDQEIQRWRQMLANQFHYPDGPQDAANGGNAEIRVALRLRFLVEKAVFEWQRPGGEWIELKPSKIKAFDQQYADHLSPEAALLWLPLAQRNQVYYTPTFTYNDPWLGSQLGRWFHQPVLRPLLVNELGEPLVFHEAPARWQVAPAASEDDDYAFSLVQASGDPLPPVWHATGTRPAFYLTAHGVFQGPPADGYLISAKDTTRIPAAALETAHGLRLLQRLRLPPPPRLAARICTVKLHPCVRATMKEGWSGSEYCHLEVFGASECGRHVEYWSGDGWVASTRKSEDDLTQLDRSGLAALVPPLNASGFKWDFTSRRWQLRVTKKFAEPFVAFLKALPPETRIDLGGELASLKDAEVAGQIRLHASESELDWFDLRVIVDVNDATLTPEEIKLLLDAKGGWVRLEKKGWRKLAFALSEEEDQQLARLGLTPHELTSEPQRLHALQLADQAARKFLPAETCDRIERRASELQARVTPEMPPQIQAEMRPYQRDGFHFLAYLATNRFGGILADDMGLGKTLQTLAWLAWLRGRVTAAAPPPSLVVCPKSVVDNWQAEGRKFFPALKVRVWTPSELKTMSAE
ncbi:MAG TPA: SNF2-related protein, partial [Verrucomicrobiae bacterium]